MDGTDLTISELREIARKAAMREAIAKTKAMLEEKRKTPSDGD